jgi:transcriptional regulator with XRE-family HTH domain
MYIFIMTQKKRGFPRGKKHTDIPRSPFGERLYKTRKSRGISQTELGKRIGISQRMISHYEGSPPDAPPVSTLSKMAETLKVTVSYLLGESTLKSTKEDITPNIRKHIDTLHNLPPNDQKKVLEYADLLGSAKEKR